ncbi:MAG: ankyrin repeat domain-containing protein [Bacillota bacterium]|nr:ankyrin repeat domain-containing protein [Bacillota bacterium]
MKKIFYIVIIVSVLMISVSTVYSSFMTDITNSAKAGNVNRLNKQLESKRYNNKTLVKALFAAITYNRPKAVAALIKHLDINDNSSFLNESPPLIAAVNYPEVVKVLVEGGANVNKLDYSNRNALSYSVLSQNYDTTEYLLNHGADTNLDGWFNRPINDIESIKQKKIIKLLISKGANLNSELGVSVLTYAIDKEDYELIDLLFKNGCQPQLSKVMSYTIVRNSKMFNYLIEKGLSLDNKYVVDHLDDLTSRGDMEALSYYLNNGPRLDNEQLERLVVDSEVNCSLVLKMLISKGYVFNEETKTHLLTNTAGDRKTDKLEDILNYSKNNKVGGNLLFEKSLIEKVKQNVLAEKKDLAWFDFAGKKKIDKVYDILDKY